MTDSPAIATASLLGILSWLAGLRLALARRVFTDASASLNPTPVVVPQHPPGGSSMRMTVSFKPKDWAARSGQRSSRQLRPWVNEEGCGFWSGGGEPPSMRLQLNSTELLGKLALMRPERFGSHCPTSEKLDLVLRLLAGETLAELARETGRPRKQLSAWRRRFLAAGEASLEGGSGHLELEGLRSVQAELAARVGELKAENRMLGRRLTLASARPRLAASHPYCSEPYARALEEPGVERLYVAVWDTYVLVREGQAGVRQATAVRPLGSLDPSCDPHIGLEALREAGIALFSMITDPMWCPEVSPLQAAFDICRPFKKYYVVDREADIHIRKRHRNRINQARRTAEVHDVSLTDHLDRWLELYRGNVDRRRIHQPFTRAYFERLTKLDGLRTVAVVSGGEVVTLSLWIPHQDTMYFHDGASSDAGMAISAAHAAFAHIIDTAADCRYVLLGGSAGFRDESSDGLAVFKRGFANASMISYLCSTSLSQVD
jgi:transposase-like protein